jgi:hypothetical protein
MHSIDHVGRRVFEQPDEGLVHDRCGLQGMPGRLALHERSGNAPQLCVHERHQLVERSPVALAKPIEQTRYLGHRLTS